MGKLCMLSSPKETCAHPEALKGKCTSCRQQIDEAHGVAFDYKQRGLRLSRDEITRLKDTNSKKLFEEKKLQLVLDLDKTLIHSKPIIELTPDEIYLIKQACFLDDESKEGSLFKLRTERIVKLRPFVRTFLREANTMFEIYIYTNGSRFYAIDIAELLDPEGTYFDNRIIYRQGSNQNSLKNLDLVLGQECGIIILDDLSWAWSKDHRKNLVPMKDYTYFAKDSKHKSYSVKKEDESESDGVLACVLAVIKAIHSEFFSQQNASLPCKDVRMLLKLFRSKILMGCVIFFNNPHQYYSHIKVKAKQLGAKVTELLDSTVTHVVSMSNVMKDCVWDAEQEIFLVNPQWIETTYYLWVRQPEDDFSLLN